MISRLRAFWTWLTRRDRMEAGLDRELRFHLEACTDDLVRNGLPRSEAERRARLEFGGLDEARDGCRRALGLRLVDEFRQDIACAARSLRRSPGFLVAAALTLALGIGANTAIFSAVDEALLRPLPLPHSDRLAVLYSYKPKSSTFLSTSYPNFQDLAAGTRAFESLAAYVRVQFNLSAGGSTQRLPLEAVTPNYFDVLQLAPLAGRAFRADDADRPVILLSEDLWRARFQSDPALLGRSVQLESQPFQVIGIVPRWYHGTNLNWGDPPQAWVPLRSTPLLWPIFGKVLQNRANGILLTIGRLNPGVTVQRAAAEARLLAAGMAQANKADRDLTVLAFAASQAKFWPAYRERVVEWLTLFAGAALLVLLLACANVSNLLLERTMNRRREFAIRLSIGAGQGRLLRQLITEYLLLILPGFLLSLVVARGLQVLLAQTNNAFGTHLSLGLTLEGRMLAFCALLTLVTPLLFGLAPALRAMRTDFAPALRQSGNASSSGGRQWARHSLVVAQVALCAVLLLGGGLFARSLLSAYAIDPGFRPDHLLLLEFSAPAKLSGAPEQNLYRHVLDRAAAIPGVASVSLAPNLPLTGIRLVTHILHPADVTVNNYAVGPDYLHTMGMPLISGRDITAADTASSPRVTVVTEALARQLWPAQEPLGQTLTPDVIPGPLTVVGVTRDARNSSLWSPAEPAFYTAHAQSTGPLRFLLLRTFATPEGLIPEVRRAWEQAAPDSPIVGLRTGDALVNASVAPQRVAAGLLGAFSLLAVVLSAVGLYGVVAFAVSQRTREIGIRLAIGATPGDVVSRILRQALLLATLGLVAGGFVAAATLRFLESQVKGVSTRDPLTILVVIALLILVSVTAALVPAMRASRLDPMTALHSD